MTLLSVAGSLVIPWKGFVSLWAGVYIYLDVTWILSSQRSGDEEEDTLHVVLCSTCPLPRHSCQIVQAHQL